LSQTDETESDDQASAPESSTAISLREALMKKMLESKTETASQIDDSFLGKLEAVAVDIDEPPAARFLSLLDQLSQKVGKAVKISLLREHASDIEMSGEELDDVIDRLVKEGTVYLVDEETLRRADIRTE